MYFAKSTTIGLVLLLSCAAAIAGVNPPTAPEYTTSEFTVTWPGPASNQLSTQLQERLPGGPWNMISGTVAAQGSMNLSRSPGTYEYRTRAVEEFFHNPYEPDIRFVFSTPITVQVVAGEIPTVDELPDQLGYEYEVRFNGYQDIFVKRVTSADENNGTIDALILRSGSGGALTPLTSTAAQIAAASNWAIADVDIVVDDINIDGFVDLSIRRLAGLIAGATDQIVFAPGEILNSTPSGVAAIDQNMIDFANDMVNYYVDPNYFDNNSEIYEEPGHWEWEYECDFYWWGDSPEIECEWYPEWVDGDEYVIYPGINPDAVSVWEAISGQSSSNVKSVLEQIFGVVIGGGSYCVDFGIVANDDECDGLEIELVWTSFSGSITSGGGQCNISPVTTAVAASGGLVKLMERLINLIRTVGATFEKIDKVLLPVHLVEIAFHTASNTVKWALKDIEYTKREAFTHVGSSPGSIIPWHNVQIPWMAYGCQSTPNKQILVNFMNDARPR